MELFWIDTNTGENTIWRLECCQQKLSCIILWFGCGRQSHWTDVWPSSHGSQSEPVLWFQETLSAAGLDFRSRAPSPTLTEAHILDGADLNVILSQDWPSFAGVSNQTTFWKLFRYEMFSVAWYWIGLWKTQRCSRLSAQPALSVEERLLCKSPWECQALFNHCISILLLITLQCSHRVTT